MNLVKKLAADFGFTQDYIRKVITGKRHNKAVSDAYIIYKKENERAAKKVSKLLSKTGKAA